MHNHCHCEHVIKHCNHCDVAYCTKCGKEWKVPSNWYYYTTPNYYGSSIGNQILCDAKATVTTANSCSHK